MTVDQVMMIFEEMATQSQASGVTLHDICSAYAQWVAQTWRNLSDDDRAILAAVGGMIWEEGRDSIPGSATR